MKRFGAATLAFLLALTAPGFAQTVNPPAPGTVASEQSSTGTLPPQGAGTTAMAQVPPEGDNTGLLIGGGLILGGGALAVYLATQNKSDTPVSP